VGKALAAPKRIELLGLLCEGPRTVEVLAALTSQSVANTSQHLRGLLRAQLVAVTRRGLFIEYRVADLSVVNFLYRTQELAESRLVEIRDITDRFLKSQDGFETVTAVDLVQRVRAGRVTIVDVRPTEEYEAGHIAGALSVPLPELKKRLAEIPKGRQVVAYCRGRYCLMSLEAVSLLRKAGLQASRMKEGVIDWRVRGWKIETGIGQRSILRKA
jgi:rhodanese-related sulfurtransferase/DNA-binding transcriptional ArsR family regulator